MPNEKKLNIAMVAACPFPANRGTPSRVLGMAQALAALGHQVRVVTYHFGLEGDTGGFAVDRIPRMPYARFRAGPTFTKLLLLDPLLSCKLLRVVRSREIDLIHAHHIEGALASLPVRRITGIPVIYDGHTSLESELFAYRFPWNRGIARYLDRRVPEWADHVVACSPALRDSMIGSGVPAGKIDVIPTGIRREHFESIDPTEIRTRYGLEGKRIIMYTGSLASFQGVDYLIDAMKEVLRQSPEAVLFLVVDALDRRMVERCEALGARDRVILEVVERFEAVPRFLASADVVVLPRTECVGFPQKLANYLASGKAIVCFQGSAGPVRHEESGLVVEKAEAGALAEAILRLVRDEVLGRRLGENARKLLRDQLEWGSLALRLQDTYHRLLGHRGMGGDAV